MAPTREQAGFSLIEVMIVVVIMGILATIALPNYTIMHNRAKEGSVKGNAHAVQLVVEDFSVMNDGQYPAAAANVTASLFPGSIYPNNPFTGAASSIGPAGTFSQGNIGYVLVVGIYTIEGYGFDAVSGVNADGIVISLTSG